MKDKIQIAVLLVLIAAGLFLWMQGNTNEDPANQEMPVPGENTEDNIVGSEMPVSGQNPNEMTVEAGMPVPGQNAEEMIAQ